MKKIVRALLIILIQVLCELYLNLGAYIYLAIFPYLILTLPYKIKTLPAMVISFGLGLLIDLLSNGVMGLNAGALTAMALFRQRFVSILVNVRNLGASDSPSLNLFGHFKFFVFSLLSASVFFITYILFDSMGFHPFLFNLLRLMLCVVINTVLWSILSFILQDRGR